MGLKWLRPPYIWRKLVLGKRQWQIQGRGPRGSPPLFLDQTEAQRAENNFFRPPPYLGVWMTAPPLSAGLNPPLELPGPPGGHAIYGLYRYVPL